MPNLNEVLGAILNSIASARRMADEQTVRLAEQYLQDPLLAGMSVPRIRLPEVIVDLPILIEGCDQGAAAEEPAPRAAPTGPLRPTADGFAQLGVEVLQRLHANQGAAPRAQSGPLNLRVLVAAEDLRASGDKDVFTRLKLTLREEGMEISEHEDPRGVADDGAPRAVDPAAAPRGASRMRLSLE